MLDRLPWNVTRSAISANSAAKYCHIGKSLAKKIVSVWAGDSQVIVFLSFVLLLEGWHES
jgi:hypothetical protein